MSKRKYVPHDGELVQIRSWDDMKNEFGLDSKGNIKCRKIFTQSMKELCGRTFIVQQSSDGIMCSHRLFNYWISADTIKPVENCILSNDYLR